METTVYLNAEAHLFRPELPLRGVLNVYAPLAVAARDGVLRAVHAVAFDEQSRRIRSVFRVPSLREAQQGMRPNVGLAQVVVDVHQSVGQVVRVLRLSRHLRTLKNAREALNYATGVAEGRDVGDDDERLAGVRKGGDIYELRVKFDVAMMLLQRHFVESYMSTPTPSFFIISRTGHRPAVLRPSSWSRSCRAWLATSGASCPSHTWGTAICL